MSDIVIVGGPPGSGKTRLARGLAEAFTPGVHLEADAFFHFIVSGYLAPWRPESDTQNHVVNTAVARAAVAYATSGYTVIIDGINGPWFLDHLVTNLEPRRGSLHYVIVSCDANVAVERIHERFDGADVTSGADVNIDDEAVRFMHAQFRAADTTAYQVLDTSVLTSEEALAHCRALLDAGRLRLEA
jgi:predicted kinase